MERACEGQEVVMHTVALVRGRESRPAGDFADVMVKGTWHIAEACVRQGVRRLVNVSSIVAAGWPEDSSRPSRPEDPPAFRAGDLYYWLAKHLGEQVCLAYHQAHGLQVINLRPGIIARDGANAEPARPQGDGGFWFAHVDPLDVAQAVEAALEADVAWGTYSIVAGRSDALFDWRPAAEDLGYRPEHNWPDL
jgi:nucleoside-diphosphate-sugar epimerase